MKSLSEKHYRVRTPINVFHIPPFMPKSIVVPMGNNTVHKNIRNG